ncbi:WPE palindromic element domain-containing protein [Wolbachia endosymbiont of Tettigetta isshikii]
MQYLIIMKNWIPVSRTGMTP